MERKRKVHCNVCNKEFEYTLRANFTIYCPKCRHQVHNECEYGYGPVTPYYFCIGDEVIGKVELDRNQYTLLFKNKIIKLKQTYYEAIKEAEHVLCQQD
ncbi:MAG: hypothetical protein K2N51_17425 [Lachnospiraceae bacterium]|nr:hypothetical protein [Lachnospiraceae bacterium]